MKTALDRPIVGGHIDTLSGADSYGARNGAGHAPSLGEHLLEPQDSSLAFLARHFVYGTAMANAVAKLGELVEMLDELLLVQESWPK